jgi:hypothetical protein
MSPDGGFCDGKSMTARPQATIPSAMAAAKQARARRAAAVMRART